LVPLGDVVGENGTILWWFDSQLLRSIHSRLHPSAKLCSFSCSRAPSSSDKLAVPSHGVRPESMKVNYGRDKFRIIPRRVNNATSGGCMQALSPQPGPLCSLKHLLKRNSGVGNRGLHVIVVVQNPRGVRQCVFPCVATGEIYTGSTHLLPPIADHRTAARVDGGACCVLEHKLRR